VRSLNTQHTIGGNPIGAEIADNPLGGDIHTNAGCSLASNLSAFIQFNMRVSASHEPSLASDNPLISFASRTSSSNQPSSILQR
jgi:hypothetical protein